MSAVISNEELKAIYEDASTQQEVKTAIENAVKSDEGHETAATQEKVLEFLQASKAATVLNKKPSNETMIDLYALYKQGLGATPGPAPSMIDFTGKVKYKAWQKVINKGITSDDAQTQYVELVKKLQAADQ
ncbi:acyl-CoA-binding protein (ACBP)/diazepam binding inhibitor (DBI)/endozepine (EP) [Coemansia sp. RSA 1721]|nr:acyl-CoA-binding protein (ACBP)/diazepam binding inhibitor (DBI)/endozepine (EP) [Coemansia sp. RSA 1721]